MCQGPGKFAHIQIYAAIYIAQNWSSSDAIPGGVGVRCREGKGGGGGGGGGGDELEASYTLKHTYMPQPLQSLY